MVTRHLLQRMSPSIDWRWPVVLVVAAVIALVVTFIRWTGPAPPLDLVALGPEGAFVDSLDVPVEWADTATLTPDAVTRIPLILGVRNTGRRPVRPARLVLSLPVRYRLTAQGRELQGVTDPSSPLIRYAVDPGLGPIEPGRLPVLLPTLDTLWLEVVIPRFYCVALADSIPEFVPAPPPPVGPLSRVRVFYAFEGGDLGERRTGTLTAILDSSLLDVRMPDALPAFPMQADPVAAQPPLGALTYAGSRSSRCGEPEDPMELMSSVWETPDGGRFFALDYGGAVRKHLYDLDGDDIIERESWDPDGDGTFEATRRARIPVPDFLLPRGGVVQYPMARFDSLSPDSLTRLDPFRRAMTGPGSLPAAGDTAAVRAAAPPAMGPAAAGTGTGMPETGRPGAAPGLDALPAPRIEAPRPLGQPLGTPVRRPPPDTGGG